MMKPVSSNPKPSTSMKPVPCNASRTPVGKALPHPPPSSSTLPPSTQSPWLTSLLSPTLHLKTRSIPRIALHPRTLHSNLPPRPCSAHQHPVPRKHGWPRMRRRQKRRCHALCGAHPTRATPAVQAMHASTSAAAAPPPLLPPLPSADLAVTRASVKPVYSPCPSPVPPPHPIRALYAAAGANDLPGQLASARRGLIACMPARPALGPSPSAIPVPHSIQHPLPQPMYCSRTRIPRPPHLSPASTNPVNPMKPVPVPRPNP